MAFHEKPIVDQSAERSQISILRTCDFFSKKNGFIAHKIDGSDDYGVDLYIQLTLGNKATSYQFPIQVKSKEILKDQVYEDKIYKSLVFRTSRLGHLIEHKPTTGIIVIYDAYSNELFYDFSYEIYNRIRQIKDDDSWKKQENVSILVPKSNQLTEESISGLHKRLIRFFKNHSQLVEEKGKEYNLPNLTNKSDDRIDNPLDFLERFGGIMFNDQRFAEIVSLLDQLDKKSLRRERISYLGAITYAEIGELTEADYFFKLCARNNHDYPEEEIEVMEFQKFRLAFLSGKLSKKQLKDELIKIRPLLSSVENSVSIDLTKLQLEVAELIGQKDFNEEVFDRINSFFDEISSNNTYSEEIRHSQLVSLSDITSMALGRILTDMLVETKLFKIYGNDPTTLERQKKSTAITSLYNKCYSYFLSSLDFAKSNNSDLLLADTYYSIACLFFGQCMAFYHAEMNFDDKDLTLNKLELSLISATKAFNLYKKQKLTPNAYRAINLSYEIHVLGKDWASIDLDSCVKLADIENSMNGFDNSDFNKNFKPTVEKTTKLHQELDSKKESYKNFSLLTDEDILTLAKIHIVQGQLPMSRFDNIVSEIRAFKSFYSNCNIEDLELRSDNNQHLYTSKPKFAIISKTTGIIYAEGYDINQIMKKLQLK